MFAGCSKDESNDSEDGGKNAFTDGTEETGNDMNDTEDNEDTEDDIDTEEDQDDENDIESDGSEDIEGSEDTEEDEDTQGTDGTEEADFVYNTNYMTDHLGSYSVTYKFTYFENGEETESMTVLLKKNEEGYYFNLYDGQEIMYLKEGDEYIVCMKDEENGPFKKIDGYTMTEDDVKGSAEMVLTYMSFYSDYIDDLSNDGEETVCGRSCDKYFFDASEMGVSSKVEFYIDKETGVCLKYSVDASADGESGGFKFECTEFSLENVELPAYEN
jgi:hypothetical protein